MTVRPHKRDDSVVNVANLLLVSEYEVFELAYRAWYREPMPRAHLDACFVAYLHGAVLPAWVRDFTRRTLVEAADFAEYPATAMESLVAALRIRFARPPRRGAEYVLEA